MQIKKYSYDLYVYKRGLTVILKQKAKKNQIWRYQYCATARPQLFPEAVLKIIVFSKGFFFNKLYQKNVY